MNEERILYKKQEHQNISKLCFVSKTVRNLNSTLIPQRINIADVSNTISEQLSSTPSYFVLSLLLNLHYCCFKYIFKLSKISENLRLCIIRPQFLAFNLRLKCLILCKRNYAKYSEHLILWLFIEISIVNFVNISNVR